MRRRISLTLDEATSYILEEMENASEYVTRLIGTHYTDGEGALFHVRSCGFADREIIALVHMSKGAHPQGAAMAPGMSRRMLMEAEVQCARHGLDIARWRAHAEAVAGREELARAVWTIAQECWFGNTRLRRDLGFPQST